MAAKSMIHVIIIVYVEKVFSAFTAYYTIFLILRFFGIDIPYAKSFCFRNTDDIFISAFAYKSNILLLFEFSFK